MIMPTGVLLLKKFKFGLYKILYLVKIRYFICYELYVAYLFTISKTSIIMLKKETNEAV